MSWRSVEDVIETENQCSEEKWAMQRTIRQQKAAQRKHLDREVSVAADGEGSSLSSS